MPQDKYSPQWKRLIQKRRAVSNYVPCLTRGCNNRAGRGPYCAACATRKKAQTWVILRRSA